jgi:membrane fusion protein (multidrug efflux system)
MNRSLLILLPALVFSGCRDANPAGGNTAVEVKPTATVQTVKLERAPIAAMVIAYGTVVAQAGELEGISVQYESKVVRLLVSAGEQVEKGRALIEIEPSPDAKLAIRQARTAAESSRSQLEETKKRFDMRLAVNTELQQAELAAKDAASKLASLEDRGAGERTTLKADLAGIIATIDARMGQIVTAGAPLLSLVPEKQIEVRVGVEPDDAARMRAGEKVRIAGINLDGTETIGAIRLVTRRVNPQTRLIDMFVTVPPDAPLILDGYVRGEIAVDKKDALVVPRGAVLPGTDGSILFTVRDGHAVEHKVTTGIETDDKTEVIGGKLQAGDEVVTVGNYQLEDGMAVTVGQPTP